MKTNKSEKLLMIFHPSATLALILGLSTSPAWATSPITGDTVTGDLTVVGDTIIVDDGVDPFELRLGTNRIDLWRANPGEWVWSHGATPSDVMSLGANNMLSLYDLGAASVDPAIILNPGNPDASPAVPPSIMIGGNEVLTASSAMNAGFIHSGNLAGEISSLLTSSSVYLSGGTGNGANSTAMSAGTANGDYSTAAGATTVSSYSAAAFGRYNENRNGSNNGNTWNGTSLDSVFEIGIGSNSNNRANALTVLQNGSVEIGKDATDGSIPLKVKSDGSVVLAKPQGDISMGIYQ